MWRKLLFVVGCSIPVLGMVYWPGAVSAQKPQRQLVTTTTIVEEQESEPAVTTTVPEEVDPESGLIWKAIDEYTIELSYAD